MPPRPPRPPEHRHYKPKDLAVVRIAGRDHYLGRYGSPESYERYDRLVAEWLLTRQRSAAWQASPSNSAANSSIAINELILAFWQHAKQRYVKNGEPTSELRSYRTALHPVRQLCGHEQVINFGPLASVACRQKALVKRMPP